MSGRVLSLGVAVALLLGLIVAATGAILAACYDVPTPDCGFQCGPEGACPDGYTCASDGRCHRIGAPASLVCPGPDAAVRDASIDAGIDAVPDAAADAALDAAPDAAVDAAPDAALDAAPDAAADAAIDAPPDAPM